MPEALAALPMHSVQTGNSSETDGGSTARSTDDARVASEAAASSASTSAAALAGSPTPLPKKSIASQLQKPRKSKGKRNIQKQPMKKNLQPKTAATKNAISRIPRSFQQLSRSPSTTSLSTLSTRSQSPQLMTSPRQVLTSAATPSQISLHRLNFRLRKSYSQMDFKQSCRTTSFSKPLGVGLSSPQSLQDGVKMMLPKGGMVSESHTVEVQKVMQQDEYYYVLQERDPKVAGMRVFATIMLNAWRKRRDEVKQLTRDVADLKRGFIKVKNQLHVYNTLFRVEQKRNGEVSSQLKRVVEECNITKSSCESLTNSLITATAEKALLEQQLMTKGQEYEGLNTVLSKTQSDLFELLTLQRELQVNYALVKRKEVVIEQEKDELKGEICALTEESMRKEQERQKHLQEKDAELEAIVEENHRLKEQLAKFDEYELKLANFAKAEVKYQAEVEALQSQVDALTKSLEQTFACRMKACWLQTVEYQRTTLQVLHWVAYYTLPAIPPPKMRAIPFGVSLQKAMSIVKH